MITKLTPEQVSSFWDVIKYAIEESLPPTVDDHPDKMNRILTSLLCSQMDCWASYEVNEDNRKFDGLMVTKILYDNSSDTKSLLIYCIYSYESASRKSWEAGTRSILKYAKYNKCSKIIAYTEVPSIIDWAKRVGAEATYTFLSFNVNELMEKV